ncbi:MAG TPA: NADH-quinone oxidoreductase subunit A, partial [Tepidisphaeraceae bacterium]|nr:NADH-quinone oxidoreductase subunit A [Tepidisphaeraceae bacterium]
MDFLLLADSIADPRSTWAPVVLLLIMGIGFAVGNVVLSSLVGPNRTGKVKEETYESGMTPIGNAKRRFNVRFYLVAIMFVALDVEIVIMYPWAASFAQVLKLDPELGKTMFIGIGVFVSLV